MEKWIAEVDRLGSNRVTTGKRVWWGAYDSKEDARKAAKIVKAARNMDELAAKAKARRKRHGWKFNATGAIIKARHGSGRS